VLEGELRLLPSVAEVSARRAMGRSVWGVECHKCELTLVEELQLLPGVAERCAQWAAACGATRWSGWCGVV